MKMKLALSLALVPSTAHAAASSLALYTAQSCAACDVPPLADLHFCGAFVKYSSCRALASWKRMDDAARGAFAQLLASANASTAAADGTCSVALQHAECAKHFSVCELGSPQQLCLDSCVATVAANCTTLLPAPALARVQSAFCGDAATAAGAAPLLGVADGGRCFAADYVGPKHSAWVVGFAIAVIFSFFASVGINLQKRALKQNELTAQEQSAEPTPPYRLPLWCLGFFLILAGSILDFVAFGLAPQSLLAPLAALTLVWNMMLAPCFNKEKLGRKDIAATLVIFAGATIAVVFASHTSPSYNLSMLIELYRDPLTCVYFVLVGLCMAIHYALIKLVDGLCLTSKRHRLIQFGQPAVWARVRLVAYSGLAGTMGGQSVLFAKSCAELFKAALNGDDCFKHVETYLLALALIGCLLCQIHYLNCGLVHYDALAVVPIYQAYWIITGVLGGAIYFQEIRTFSAHQALMFVLGIVTTIFGVVLLSKRKPAHPAQQSKRKILERGFSFTSTMEMKPEGGRGHLPTVPEVPSAEALADEEAAAIAAAAAAAIGSAGLIGAVPGNESEVSTGEESEDDDDDGANQSDEVSRHVIDNYLDMSATLCFTEILGGLGFQTSGISRRPSSRIATSGEAGGPGRLNRRSMDDIELGMPAATREANPRERVTKRRSITFTSFEKSMKEDGDGGSPPPE
ncbi:hypothetical protein PybrP1_002599 [[Pythium] brassicae (nom. inval.)]|nr:hypothetical protein PybrP1_002599 [[Pythium] brassicae (nom. inval.)]